MMNSDSENIWFWKFGGGILQNDKKIIDKKTVWKGKININLKMKYLKNKTFYFK